MPKQNFPHSSSLWRHKRQKHHEFFIILVRVTHNRKHPWIILCSSTPLHLATPFGTHMACMLQLKTIFQQNIVLRTNYRTQPEKAFNVFHHKLRLHFTFSTSTYSEGGYSDWSAEFFPLKVSDKLVKGSVAHCKWYIFWGCFVCVKRISKFFASRRAKSIHSI